MGTGRGGARVSLGGGGGGGGWTPTHFFSDFKNVSKKKKIIMG